MKIFLAGSGWHKLWIENEIWDFYRLESFHYISKHEVPYIGSYDGFLLDSGAFSYLNGNLKETNWDDYIQSYAEFINKNNIKLFFELDIDPIVGIKEVERLRHKLETLTNKKCIPVWHKSRGLDYWKKMCKEYDYVAIGGIVTKEIKRSEFDIFIPLLEIARKNKCKVHGLGFTSLIGLKKYKFHSVDSTSWLSGNRFGMAYLFDGETMIKQGKEKGQRVKTQEVALHNFKEWVKFSKYAIYNL